MILVPTLSYLAYGSEHVLMSNSTLPPLDRALAPAPLDDYAHEHRLRSLYDRHTDGSGVAITSRMRPVTNLRPKYLMPSVGAAHQFNADLHLVDWLEAKGILADFVTDEDLHHEGAKLLRPYRVLVTGSHPEYWTLQMLEALETYLDGGGRTMYLGGNGLYWVTGIDADRPHIVEVRRGQRGTGTWRSAVGENHLQTTGELGGLWLERGRRPQSLVGVGMAAQGFDRSIAVPPRARQLRPARIVDLRRRPARRSDRRLRLHLRRRCGVRDRQDGHRARHAAARALARLGTAVL